MGFFEGNSLRHPSLFCFFLLFAISLLEWGIVEESDSGESAVRAVRNSASASPFHLVLLDYKMPGMNGLETAGTIKKDSNLAKPPAIILMSGVMEDSLPSDIPENLIDSFLQKPVSSSILFKTIVRTLALEEELPESVPSGEHLNGPTLTRNPAKLATLLKESNLDLIEYYQAVKNDIRNICLPNEFSDLERAMQTDDFDRALECLRGIAARLKIKTENV